MNDSSSTPVPERRASIESCVDVKPLWKAAKKHDAVRAKELINQFETTTGSLSIVNVFHPTKSTTPLMIACMTSESGQTRSGADMVQTLLQFGADVKLQARLKDGNTAMHYAAESNQARAIEFMLMAGADAFALNANGHAAIDLARWHGSRDALEVLTQHARIHQGWLFVKKVADSTAAIQLRVWKKRYGVVLACDAERKVIELSLYKDPTDVKPHRVILLHSATDEIVSSPKSKWLDKHNMFHLELPLVVQKMSSKRRFSRSDTADVEPEQLQFAAESTQQRDEWMAILGHSNNGDAGLRRPISFRNTLIGEQSVADSTSPLTSPESNQSVDDDAAERHVSFASADVVLSPSAASPPPVPQSTGPGPTSSPAETPPPSFTDVPVQASTEEPPVPVASAVTTEVPLPPTNTPAAEVHDPPVADPLPAREDQSVVAEPPMATEPPSSLDESTVAAEQPRQAAEPPTDAETCLIQ